MTLQTTIEYPGTGDHVVVVVEIRRPGRSYGWHHPPDPPEWDVVAATHYPTSEEDGSDLPPVRLHPVPTWVEDEVEEMVHQAILDWTP